jgi:hypothetical protein
MTCSKHAFASGHEYIADAGPIHIVLHLMKVRGFSSDYSMLSRVSIHYKHMTHDETRSRYHVS